MSGCSFSVAPAFITHHQKRGLEENRGKTGGGADLNGGRTEQLEHQFCTQYTAIRTIQSWFKHIGSHYRGTLGKHAWETCDHAFLSQLLHVFAVSEDN